MIRIRRRHVLGTLGWLAFLLVGGAAILILDVDSFLGIVESRGLAVFTAVVAIVIAVWEASKWWWRLLGDAAALRIRDDHLEIRLLGPPAVRIPWDELRSIDVEGDVVVVTSTSGVHRLKLDALEPGPTLEQQMQDIQRRARNRDGKPHSSQHDSE